MIKKKICIISSADDLISEKIISWFNKLSKGLISVTRINWQDEICVNEINMPGNNCIIMLRGRSIDLNSFDYFLYRRGSFTFGNFNSIQFEGTEIFSPYLNDDQIFLNNYLFGSLRNKMLSNYMDDKISKLNILHHANKIGINIPRTIITTLKTTLQSFYENCNNKIITKAIQNGGMFLDQQFVVGAGTNLVSQEDIQNYASTFSPSLFQEMIDKEYEIRAFYLNGVFNSMAIFSQQNKKTEVDFRNYDFEKPNRTVPFKLPKEIKTNLRKLFGKLSLTTGSADLIKGKDGIFYFLEINPVGQFAQVSTPCNYQLEKKMAAHLIKCVYDKRKITINSKEKQAFPSIF